MVVLVKGHLMEDVMVEQMVDQTWISQVCWGYWGEGCVNYLHLTADLIQTLKAWTRCCYLIHLILCLSGEL
jgi:hypothetical protein